MNTCDATVEARKDVGTQAHRSVGSKLRSVRWLIGGLFLFLALAKFATLGTRAPVLLDGIDPLLKVSNWKVLVVMAPLEACLGIFWFIPRFFKLSTYLTLILSIGFLSHYIFTGAFRQEHVCPCLGAVAEWLPRVKESERFVTLTISLWLLLTSWFLLLLPPENSR